MAYSQILVECGAPVAILTRHRPARRNALSMGLLQEVLTALDELGRDTAVRAAVLRGAGPAFCAGHDLAEMVGRDPSCYRETFATCTRMMTAIQALPQLVIAQVHGIATAAGCQLVATCDLAVAEEAARFAPPGVKVGLFCSTPMVPLSRAVGRKKSMEMLLTGDSMDAREARSFGLVNKMVAAPDPADATLSLARKVAAASPLVLGMGKQAFYAQADLSQAQAYAQEVISLNAVTADAQEGMCAFLEKREAKWSGT